MNDRNRISHTRDLLPKIPHQDVTNDYGHDNGPANDMTNVVQQEFETEYAFKEDIKKLPTYVQLVKYRATKERVDLSVVESTALIQYSGYYPAGKLFPKARPTH